MSKARREHINEILKDLTDLKSRDFENVYAVDENIKFFEAMYSLPRYVWWLFKEMPKIDGSRLLELSDFHLVSLPRVTLGHRVTLGFAI